MRHDLASPSVGRASQYIVGIHEPKKPFVGQAYGKGRFQTLSSTLKSRKFESLGRYRNEASMPRLYYIPVLCPIKGIQHIPYNTRWRGLAKLLILREGNARA